MAFEIFSKTPIHSARKGLSDMERTTKICSLASHILSPYSIWNSFITASVCLSYVLFTFTSLYKIFSLRNGKLARLSALLTSTKRSRFKTDSVRWFDFPYVSSTGIDHTWACEDARSHTRALRFLQLRYDVRLIRRLPAIAFPCPSSAQWLLPVGHRLVIFTTKET